MRLGRWVGAQDRCSRGGGNGVPPAWQRIRGLPTPLIRVDQKDQDPAMDIELPSRLPFTLKVEKLF